MLNQLLPLIIAGSIALLLIFTITWLIQLKTKNAAIVDSVWAASFPLLAFIYFIEANSFTLRNEILLVMVIIWGMRLAAYLFIRTMNHEEDVRYTALRTKWGNKQNLLMLRFFYFQAILALILSLPFMLVLISPSTSISLFEWIGIAVWTIAVIGESAADAQLKKFKFIPSNKGKICQAGLWNYSRHPNYFFEWLVWVSYFIFALASPWGWLSIISPLFILYFLLKVTGIPYTEEQMIKSRGQAFIDYQKTTSAFIPLPKKNQKP
jgi:steroid 5-alpha reductase family enzyme